MELLLRCVDPPIRLHLRRNRRARRMILRMDAATDAVVMTLPPSASVGEALELAERNAPWIAAKRAALPPPVALVAGAMIPLQGIPHRIVHAAGRPAGVVLGDGVIRVGGTEATLAARLTRWLRQRAVAMAEPLARDKAARLGSGHRFQSLTVRSMCSRWGSCSSSGAISLNWRLIFAPPVVLDYVVAHETAHLVHRRHDRAFWQAAAALADDMPGARAWLQQHGAGLLRLG